MFQSLRDRRFSPVRPSVRNRTPQPADRLAVLLPQIAIGGLYMNAIIYLVGLVVVVMAILSFIGLR